MTWAPPRSVLIHSGRPASYSRSGGLDPCHSPVYHCVALPLESEWRERLTTCDVIASGESAAKKTESLCLFLNIAARNARSSSRSWFSARERKSTAPVARQQTSGSSFRRCHSRARERPARAARAPAALQVAVLAVRPIPVPGVTDRGKCPRSLARGQAPERVEQYQFEGREAAVAIK